MINKNKIIRDPIHGDIKLKDLFSDLLEAPEIQRLYNIKQLGLAHLVFPGAHHTRLEHSLGTYHISCKVADNLELEKDEKELIACAALLHDIGHGPFSHTLEYILRETLNIDHIDLTEKLIYGENSIFDEKEKEVIGSTSVFDILTKYNIEPKEIVNIIRGKINKKGYLSQILNSSIDVDQLDYLIRDGYYTGVAYGTIDADRFLQTLTINKNNLAVLKKGVGVIENILMARALMYSSVYFHKTVRIAELMLSKSIERIKDLDPFDFIKKTDFELINDLKNKGPYQNEIYIRLKYRKLFKQAYTLSSTKSDKKHIDTVKKLKDLRYRRNKEKEIEESLKIPQGHVIIDIPFYELHQAEPRIDKMDINILDENNDIKTLYDFTPIANAIKKRAIPDWDIMIITDEKFKEIVSKKAEKLLFC
jgi:HD superfamily phosphohydrolase